MTRAPPLFLLPPGVALLTLAAWWPAVEFGAFGLDDDVYVFANPHIGRLDLETIRWALLSYHEANWNPLSWLSHALDRALWGNGPAGHHATSVVLHALNAGLAVAVVHRILAGPQGGARLDGPAARGGALLAGVLFALHPVQAEAVVWIAQRKTLLAGLFSLVAVLAWLAWNDHGRRRAYALALAAFAAALMSKPTAVGLPLVLMALAPMAPGGRRRVLAGLAPFVLLAAGTAAITLLTNQLSGALDTDATIPLAQRLPAAVRALQHYAAALAWPGAIAAFHPLPAGLSLLDPGIVLSLAAMMIAAILAVSERRRRPWLAAGAVWVVAGLLPTLGVRVGLPILAAERYLYLPVLGLFLAVAGAVAPLLRAPPAGPAVAVLAAAALLPLQRPVLESWRDNVAAWNRVIAVHPNAHPLPYALLGGALREAGRPVEALAACEHALTLRPRHLKGTVCKAQALSALRRWDEALEPFDAALAADASEPTLFNDRGVARLALRRFAAAEADFRQALASGLDDVRPHYNLAVALAAQERRAEACAHLAEAARRGLPDATAPLRERTFAPLHGAPCWREIVGTLGR
ncbi:MAG TPA: tetratricopeptide repeat protein [Azospirillum sp.]|nr:tetratricopeptide repeat protein [Azospirillum sp.]